MGDPVKEYLSEIGRKGGKRSRRALDPATARQMVKVREARRAYRNFYSKCFWSYDPGYKVGASDIAWVAEQLMKYGGHDGWRIGVQLCR